jgi:hypothetical protein
LKPAWANRACDPISKIPKTKRASGVAQGIGPEFKPWYTKKKKKKKQGEHQRKGCVFLALIFPKALYTMLDFQPVFPVSCCLGALTYPLSHLTYKAFSVLIDK